MDGARLCRDPAPPDPVTEFDTDAGREVLKIVPFVTLLDPSLAQVTKHNAVDQCV